MHPRLFDVVALGQSLREVSPEFMLNENENIVSRWFHGEEDCDLYVWSDRQARVLKQQLSFFGQIVEWNIVEGLKTGLVVEHEETRAPASETVRFDMRAQRAPVEQAVSVLRHVRGLSASERGVLAANFLSPEAGTHMSADEFVQRFGAFINQQDLQRVRPAGWMRRCWARLKRLFG